jgi:integrase
MAEKLLSELACKNAKQQSKMYYLSDGGGLRLRIRPDGSRIWILRYSLNGKEQSFSLGPYPKVSLQAARQKSNELKIQTREGINLSAQKQRQKVSQAQKDATTFGRVAIDWLTHHKDSWSPHYYERNEGLIRRLLNPKFNGVPVDAITEDALLKELKKHYDSGTKESARRAAAVASQIFVFAKAINKVKQNPARDLVTHPYLKKPQVKHFEALRQDQVGDLIKELRKTGKAQILDIKTKTALLLALYTGLRDNSIRGARWSEIDFENSFWTVPPERMKSKREHKVPLPIQAVKALEALHPITSRSNDSYIFPSSGKHGFMAENTIRLALHRLGFKVTAHGMRSLITDVLNENAFNSDAVERQLDHLEQSQVRRAYLRSDFMDMRKTMMQWFADWCDSKADGKKITNITKLKVAA